MAGQDKLTESSHPPTLRPVSPGSLVSRARTGASEGSPRMAHRVSSMPIRTGSVSNCASRASARRLL